MRRDWGQGTKYFDAKRERYVYECRYKTTDGQRKRKKIVAVSKKVLAKKIKEWQTQVDNGIYSPQNDMTISTLVPIWLNSIKTSLKINTYNQYAILPLQAKEQKYVFINEANLTCIQHVSKSYTEVRQAQDKASLDEKAAANIDIDLLKLAKMLSVDINTINNDISK
ncbi:hypothetical protein [Pectinatus frisingensis]|jgi:hypothetical protein|uniref:hypothetical protein n=1 Tax=Pectinatus frisingensis TaxID=865 RepID=UPI0018C48F23|nr:hypothetical protein [Pectinatus frisingensis]